MKIRFIFSLNDNGPRNVYNLQFLLQSLYMFMPNLVFYVSIEQIRYIESKYEDQQAYHIGS